MKRVLFLAGAAASLAWCVDGAYIEKKGDISQITSATRDNLLRRLEYSKEGSFRDRGRPDWITRPGAFGVACATDRHKTEALLKARGEARGHIMESFGDAYYMVADAKGKSECADQTGSVTCCVEDTFREESAGATAEE